MATNTAFRIHYSRKMGRSTMKQSNPGPGSDQVVYQIKVQGKLDEKWSDWFGAMTVTVQSEGSDGPITTLIGAVARRSCQTKAASSASVARSKRQSDSGARPVMVRLLM